MLLLGVATSLVVAVVASVLSKYSRPSWHRARRSFQGGHSLMSLQTFRASAPGVALYWCELSQYRSESDQRDPSLIDVDPERLVPRTLRRECMPWNLEGADDRIS